LRVDLKRSFLKDLQRVKNDRLKERVRHVIERLEEAKTLRESGNIKKLRGGERHYRVRVEDYRLGLVLEGDKVTFVRFLHLPVLPVADCEPV
jgi:mRNA interferase RelE/StbE